MRLHWGRIILSGIAVILLCVDLILFAVYGHINSEEYILANLPPKPVDETPPVITLRGNEEMTVAINSTFEDPGVDSYDIRGEVVIDIDNPVDTSKEGEYTIKYTSTDESGNTNSVERKVKVIQSNGVIYLTFDDGPGAYTDRLLDILAKYNVKATFFVTGSGSDDLIKREYDEGHAIGLHTYSHNYAYIYSDMNNFFDDLYRVQNRVKDITGYESKLMRFPGGSSNTVSTRYDGGQRIMSKLASEVENRGFSYFDWNITSGDAGETTSSDSVYSRVVNNLKYGGSSVVLQHDIKGFSVDAVERIIQYGLDHGFVFAPLTTDSFTAHHGINN